MSKAPLPSQIPGDFFVLIWNRDAETFRIELDDAHHSSYDLGGNPAQVARLLYLRGFKKAFREHAVDIAREFGMAQCIPSQERVIAIISRRAPAVQFTHEEEQEPTRGWTTDFR